MPLSADDIRRQFIEFFKSKPGAGNGHSFVPSSPCVPVDDPTLLFTNAGMNQFKPIFLGQADPGTPLGKLKRAVNSQKCIRAGGKHNDLDDVGKDTYHHTFFEMLGTWSFGDYFKAESIAWGWELLTKVYGIPPERLYATYFAGNPGQGLEADFEARQIWLQFLPSSRIIPGNMKDNFWEMGDTGPCGPCSEIHVDRIGGRDAALLVNKGDPNVIEIWNHVFIQFNRDADGSLKALPAKHVDTGMGFERLVSILQEKSSNYDTDVFMPLFAAIERVTGSRVPYRGKVGAADKDNTDTAYRVIADHIRTLTFAITDGAVPSNEGRGYVLRRILRRAVRYGRQTLGAKTGFFCQLVPTVVERMGEFFPELRKDPHRVTEIIREEEESFSRTLDRGCVLFDEACVRAYTKARLTPHLQAAGAKVSGKKVETPGGGSSTVLEIDHPGRTPSAAHYRPSDMNSHWADGYFGPMRSLDAEDVFKLYDTYGFPTDLTLLMAEERGLKIDMNAVNALMDQAREKARAGGKFTSEAGTLTLPPDAIAKLKHMGIAPTDDVDKFHGREIRATVKAIWNGHDFDNSMDSSTGGVKALGLVLDRTNFYAEMGGQVADEGRITVFRESNPTQRDSMGSTGSGEFRVEDVKAHAGYVLHIGRLMRKEIRVGDEVTLTLDAARRTAVASNHTSTHLLNLALARTLGENVNQKGSLVAPDRLRFDFSHGKPVSSDELHKIEDVVKGAIKDNLHVYAEPAPLEQARTIAGLRAVFGEAYPDPVRVVSIGVKVDSALGGGANRAGGVGINLETSIEFCGGTHVSQTGDISHFAITSEEAVAKGVRRLTAISGVPARAAIQAGDSLEQRATGAERLEGEALVAEVTSLLAEIDHLAIPLTAKQRIRQRITQLQERVKAAQKHAAAGKQNEVVAAARSIAESPEYDQGSFIVTTIEAGSDRDAINAAMNTIRARRPKQAVMLISPDPEEGKMTILAGVPEAIVKRGLLAGDWVRLAAAACGGRGGGKPDAAQGGGTDLSKLKDVLSAAKAHAFSKCPV